MFLTLPAPTPSRPLPTPAQAPPRSSNASYYCSAPAAAPTYSFSDMSLYHSAAASCFHGSCLVTLSDSTTRPVAAIRQGDYVKCPLSTRFSSSSKNICVVAKVESILRTFSVSGMMNLVSFENGLLVTPWHPLNIDGRWTFPADHGETVLYPTEAVYSFLLGPEMILDLETNRILEYSTDHMGRGQSMLINNMVCITLGHGIENDPVATHSFYGTERVVEAMRDRVGGWELPDYVDLLADDFVRDPMTQLVCGFRQIELVGSYQPLQESCSSPLVEAH
jgi:hypothetical protein